MGAGAVADACRAARGRRLPGRRRLRGRVPRRLDQLARRGLEHPIIHSDVRLRRAARGRSTARPARSSGWSPPTTSAGPSTRCCARARSRARCTWASATRSPRTSPPTPTAGPTNMTLRSLGILRAKDVPPIDVDPRRVARSPTRRTASRASARSASCRPPARSPPRSTTSTASGARRCRCAATAAEPDADRVTRDDTPGLVCAHHHLYSALARGMPAPPRHADDLPRDPRAGLVAARRRARPRDARAGRRCSARSRRWSAGTTAIVDHHESPNAIEGSLDVIADACAEVGVRVRVRLRRHRPPRARRRQGAGWPRTSGSCAPAAGAWSGVHAAFTCSDDTLDAGRRPGRRPRRRRAHPRRRGRRRRDAGAAARPPGPPTTGCSSTASTSTATCPGTIAHNPRSNMNNAVGYARPARFANPVVLGTDGIGADMLEEFRLAYARLREDDVTATPDDAVVVAGRRAERSCPRPRGDRVTWTLRRRRTRGTSPSRPACAPLEVVVDGEVVLDDGRPDPRRRRRDPGQGRRAGRPRLVRAELARRTTDDRARRPLPPGRPPDPRGHGATRGTPRRAGFEAVWQAESRLVREATVPMAAFAAVTERIKVGSGVVDCWTRNPARLASTFSTLDDLAPGRVILGIGAWWDPLAAKVGIDRRQAADGRCARSSTPCGRCWPTRPSPSTASSCTSTASSSTTCTRSAGPRTCPIYIGATGMQMMELTGEIADGVVLNYLVSPAYNATGAWSTSRSGAARGRAGPSTTSTGPQLVVCSLDDDRDARARHRPPARHPVPRPAAPHHEGVGRARVAARRDRRGAHLAGHPRAGGGGVASSCPTRSCR